MKLRLFISVLILMGYGSAQAGEFLNLDFEQVNEEAIIWTGGGDVFGVRNGYGSVEQLIPGWTMFLDGNPTDTIGINTWTDSGPHSTLLQKQYEDRATPIDFIEGNYGFFGNVMYPISSVALSQTGRIPDGARELRFSGFQVAPLINGELPTRLPSGWYDITEYSGEEVELIWHFPNFGPGGDNRAGLDSIAFVVPEPSTSALLTLGAAGLLWARWRRRKASEGGDGTPRCVFGRSARNARRDGAGMHYRIIMGSKIR